MSVQIFKQMVGPVNFHAGKKTVLVILQPAGEFETLEEAAEWLDGLEITYYVFPTQFTLIKKVEHVDTNEDHQRSETHSQETPGQVMENGRQGSGSEVSDGQIGGETQTSEKEKSGEGKAETDIETGA